MEKEKCKMEDIKVYSSFDKRLKYNIVDRYYDKEIGTNNALIYHEYFKNNGDIVTNKISQQDMSCISNNIRNSRGKYNFMLGNIEGGSKITFDIFEPINNNDMGNISQFSTDITNNISNTYFTVTSTNINTTNTTTTITNTYNTNDTNTTSSSTHSYDLNALNIQNILGYKQRSEYAKENRANILNDVNTNYNNELLKEHINNSNETEVSKGPWKIMIQIWKD